MSNEIQKFKNGDLATGLGHTGLLRITRVIKKRVDIEWLNPSTMQFICNDSCLISKIRHATPEEIAAGHRIDLETLYDCDTSPNCKKFDERVK